jgi:hypothetical protein
MRRSADILSDKKARFTARVFLMATTALINPTHSNAESRTDTTTAKAGIDFRIVVPAIVRATILDQPDWIEVNKRHIELGYIDLQEATSIKLTSNSRAGYALTVNYNAKLLHRVDIQIANQSMTSSSAPSSRQIPSGVIIDQKVPVSYRLHLTSDVRPGIYRWPVALTFSPAGA